MQRVNEALAAIGEDEVTGFRLLREVIKHRDTPLDVKIQCAALLKGQEAQEAKQRYVVYMPPQLPGETQRDSWFMSSTAAAADIFGP